MAGGGGQWCVAGVLHAMAWWKLGCGELRVVRCRW